MGDEERAGRDRASRPRPGSGGRGRQVVGTASETQRCALPLRLWLRSARGRRMGRPWEGTGTGREVETWSGGLVWNRPGCEIRGRGEHVSS